VDNRDGVKLADKPDDLSRRDFIKLGVGSALAVAGASALSACSPAVPPATPTAGTHQGMQHGDMSSYAEGLMMPGFDGDVDHAANGFNPTDILTDFDYGKVGTLPSGQTLREYDVFAAVKTVEVMPGIQYEAWTYNGRVPGPTFRCTEGDRIRINFTNGTRHPHTMHFHGIHPGNMDGVYEPVASGSKFVYEFDAEPFGLHLYHCHVFPLAEHIARGLYGAFIIDPKQGRPTADREFLMVMTGTDLDFDGENDVYAVNFIPFHYDKHPIKVKVGELVRVYLANLLEFDPVNSFHLHANFFHYYPTGTSLTPGEFTDTIAQMQAQRGILEFRYKFPGKYMFHAHKTEFAELGWTGVFEVVQ
jgi:FtsP/CotA-like multicopper oxidase with cupredoxin domain